MAFFFRPAALCSWRAPSSQTPEYSNTRLEIGSRLDLRTDHLSYNFQQAREWDESDFCDPNSFSITLLQPISGIGFFPCALKTDVVGRRPGQKLVCFRMAFHPRRACMVSCMLVLAFGQHKVGLWWRDTKSEARAPDYPEDEHTSEIVWNKRLTQTTLPVKNIAVVKKYIHKRD